MRVIKWLDKNFELVCLAALLIVMTVLSFVNVIMRYCFHNAIGWSDEVCCYCLALSAFFCLPCSIRYRTAIRDDTFLSAIPKKFQKVLNLICNVIMIAFFVICVKGGMDLAATSAEIGQKSPALRIPVDILYYVTTFCFIIAIVRTVQIIILDFKGKNEEEDA